MFRRVSTFAALSLATSLAVVGTTRGDTVPTQPAGMAPARVLVIPFSMFNVPDSQQWMGHAIEENLIADLGRSNVYSPIAYQGQGTVEDNNTAATLGHKADAPLVIRGSAQVVDQSLRITAQMIDAGSGNTITTASVTGNSNDLLKLEDDLSAQLQANATAVANAQAQNMAQQQQQVAAQPSQPVVVNSPPISYTPSYTPGYSYTPAPTYVYTPYYYDPGYYGYNNSIIIGGYYWGGRSWGGRSFDRDDFRGRGGFDRDDFHSGGGFSNGGSRGGFQGGGTVHRGGFQGGASSHGGTVSGGHH